MTQLEVASLLAQLDLRGRQVVVHSSLKAFGRVQGGAAEICAALMDAVGSRGTILMPAFTFAETLRARDADKRAASVAFHPELPVSREIGAIPECFRKLGSVLRSNHPTHSFSAWGRNAREVLSTQRDNNILGPLKKLNVVQGDLLQLGTDLRTATIVHLAEEQCAMPYLERRTAVRVNSAGYDERVVLENVPGCSQAFDRLEPTLDPAQMRTVDLPAGRARRLPIRYLVNTAATALKSKPDIFACDDAACESCANKRRALAAAATEPL